MRETNAKKLKVMDVLLFKKAQILKIKSNFPLTVFILEMRNQNKRRHIIITPHSNGIQRFKHEDSIKPLVLLPVNVKGTLTHYQYQLFNIPSIHPSIHPFSTA